MEQDAHNEDIIRGGEIQFKGNDKTQQSHLMLVGKLFSLPVSYEFSVWSRGVGRISYSQLCTMAYHTMAYFVPLWFPCEVATFCPIV